MTGQTLGIKQTTKKIGTMIREAMQELPQPTTPTEIIRLLKKKYPEIDEGLVRQQVTATCVNMPSRVNFPENSAPRIATDPELDVLYRVDFGQYVLYDQSVHGTWSIDEENGELIVRLYEKRKEPPAKPLVEEKPASEVTETEPPTEPKKVSKILLEGGYMESVIKTFTAQAHLRDILKQGLYILEDGLKLFVDKDGKEGYDYPSPVGTIDLIGQDKKGGLVLVKIERAEESTTLISKLAAQVGWVKETLSGGKEVRAFILSANASEELKYACKAIPNVSLFEYEFHFELRRL